TITVNGLPAGVAAAPLEIPESEVFGSLLLTTDANAPTGTTPLTVTATNGSFSASATVAIAVEQNAVRIVSLDPSSVTVAAGANRRVVVEVERTGSFRTLALPVSAAGLPAGVTAEPIALAELSIFLPAQSSSGVLFLRAGADAVPGGPARVTINAGTSGADPVLASAPLDLAVVQPFDMPLAAPPVSL